MDIGVVGLSSGRASLGQWGSLHLIGRREAVVRSTVREDFAIPPEIAEELPPGVAVLADGVGRLLCLPYSGESIACIDLVEGSLAYPLIQLHREADRGLRMATVRLVPGWGVLHLTEESLCLFDRVLGLAWRREASFMGWSIEGVQDGRVMLLDADWEGRERRQVVSLADGDVVG